MNTRNPPFITDAGAPIKILRDGVVVQTLPRYGVWVFDKGRRKYQVAECSDDLPALTAKHEVTLPVRLLSSSHDD